LKAAYNEITVRKQGDIVRYGRYLFTTLLGEALWAKIAQKATTQNATFIELALSWAKDENGQERDLHRQPWEMMHNGTEFLARVFPHLVTVTRLVAGNALEPRQLGLPPRVLFVIGSKIDDPQIRPGAEYLGLLRQIRSENGARSIHTRIFCTSAGPAERKITPSSLRTVVKDFQPDVVHFICHGGFDSAQRRGYLELEAEPGETDKKRYADKLLECLHAGERPPVIVVLSACYSAVAAAQPNAQPEPPTLLRASTRRRSPRNWSPAAFRS